VFWYQCMIGPRMRAVGRRQAVLLPPEVVMPCTSVSWKHGMLSS
jgi:hypothetical protein